MPSWTHEPADTYEHEGIQVLIYQDDDARNPYTEWDQASTLLYDGDYDFGTDAPPHPESSYSPTPSSAVMARYLTLFGGYALAIPWTLQDYGSSGLRVYLSDPDEDAADGWVVMSQETIDREWDGDREKAEACARAEFGSFKCYVEGEVYGYVVAPGTPDEDSCWGFYDTPGKPFDDHYVHEEAKSIAAYIAKERREARALPWLPTFGNPIRKEVTT